MAGLALGASRVACYLAVALVLGGLGSVGFVWRPALRSIRGAGAERPGDGFSRRAGILGLTGCTLGAAGALGLLAAGNRLSDSSFWLVVEASSWVAVGVLMLVWAWPRETGPWGVEGLLTAGCAPATLALVLAGEPNSAFVGGLSIIHVIAAGVWAGGIVYLVIALPAALRRLDQPHRTDLLLGVLSRFSPLALASVIAIVLTGTVHTAVVLPRVEALWGTAFGRLVIVKLLLVAVLVGLGAVNRYRVIPALRGCGSRRREPRRAALLVRRALIGEVVAMVLILTATAALVAAAPSPRHRDPYPYAHVDSRRSAPQGADGDRGR